MSNLLSQASLVMIPSGYKEDVVYSQIPTSGAGDLSFTRASNGTRINSAGLVEVCPWNLAEQSETFDNATWVKTTDGQVTITANTTTAPNGTTTADKMIASANAGFHCVAQTQSLVAGVFTISIYAKASEYSFLQIFDSLTTDFANFNLTTGAVATVDQYTATIENVGNGWYRCTASKSNPSGNFVFRYGIVTTGTATRGESFTGNGVNGLFIWGAQLNIGSTAKPYFPTTDRLNVPRLTYQNGGGGCPSLLLEKQSTNIVTYSEQFDNADWNKYQCSISANQTTSPDGTQNADKLTLAGGSGTYTGLTYRLTTPGANSIFMKNDSIGNGKFYIQVDGIGNASWNANGTLASVSGGTATNGENMGNGWFRFTYVCSGGAYINYGIENGTTGDSIFIWGAQVEASSYPTSYIPTTSSSATRVAEGSFTSGLSALIGQTEGTLFAIISSQQAGSLYNWLNLSDNTVNNWVFIGKDSTKWRAYVKSNGSVIFDNSSISITNNTFTKIALAYKSGDIALYINGTQIATSSGTFTFSGTLSKVSIGDISNVVGDNAQYSEILVSKTRLTNAELASLTTI